MATKERTATIVLRAWFDSAEGVIAHKNGSSIFTVVRKGSASVDIETDTHAINICAWDNGLCLDIQIMEIAGGTSTFPTTGSCKNESTFTGHLDELMEWFASTHHDA